MMGKSVSVRLTEAELLMLRHAMRIGGEDGSLIPQTDSGDEDPVEAERYERVVRKINDALRKAQP